MEIEYSKLLKIDNENDEISVDGFANTDNVQNYIVELIQECGNNEGDREYKFDDTLNTTQDHVNCIIQNQDRDAKCESLANRLLRVEQEAKENIAHLHKDIPKGVLVIAYAKMTESEYKFIIIKADYTEFLEEISGERKSGVPTKKKIFKSFIMNVSIYDNVYEIGKIVTYDSNSTKAKYWWKTFLELEEIRDNEKNTLTAYESIKTNVLDKIKMHHKQDYLYLWNATIAYFRAEGDFDLNHYRDDIIGAYQPFDSNLEIDKLKEKITRLPEKDKFDSHFVKVPSVIKAKFKNIIRLTDEIDLHIKHDIVGMSRVIKAEEDDEGNKYIMIQSVDGYNYAQGLSNEQNS